ncbi:MAG: SWIM zinc finger family protein [Planctomycetota bacterium]
MEFNFNYAASSSVNNTGGGTDMKFAPDTNREPTFFRGDVGKAIEFREAISALHDVVVSDLRWKPKDRTEYLAWRARQDEIDWAAVASQRADVAEKLEKVRSELDAIRKDKAKRMRAYYIAQNGYFKYLYKQARDWWIVLDPVITVHPDEVFFECFSEDESSYGRLSASYEVFKNVGEFACGTTNIDYSAALYDEFQKIRTYKTTSFEIDPSGFNVETTGEAAHKEVKIDLPDSWVRGFLQVSSAMSLPMISFQLHPMDVHNICFVLRRHKELKGPRSIRYQLEPGRPVKVIFDPWGKELVCPRSVYTGSESHEIRVWGRRRLHILERLVAQAKAFDVHLLGTGMPSFYVADLGDMSFTLGLSGWTTNNWSQSGNFDLLAPRADVDNDTKQRVFAALKDRWSDTPDALAQRLSLDRKVVLGALSAYTQAGRAIWDLKKNVYRARELSRDPLPLSDLRFTNERESAATRLVESNDVRVTSQHDGASGTIRLEGKVKDKKKYDVTLTINSDEQIVDGTCNCNFFQQNRLRKGPCGCMLALKMQHHRQANSSLFARLLG